MGTVSWFADFYRRPWYDRSLMGKDKDRRLGIVRCFENSKGSLVVIRFAVLIGVWVLLLVVASACNGTSPASPDIVATTESLPSVPAPETISLAGREIPTSQWVTIPIEVRAYLVEIERYTTPLLIAYAPQMAVDYLQSIAAEVERMMPPEEMALAHANLVKGYRQIAEGRRLQVENIGDNLLQAEAHSLTDYGQMLLREHVDMVSIYLKSFEDAPQP